MLMRQYTFAMLMIFLVPCADAAGTRLKDLVMLEGVRDNQLVGYGVVVGLNGTGDKRQTVFSAQSLANLLQRMGVTVPPAAMLVRNTAAVIVTATLPPFAQTGTRIDVTASAVGDASNLQGGILVLTPLKAADGQVYAAAQGSVVTGGFVAGRGGNSQTSNHPTVARISEGAIVERTPTTIAPSAVLRLQLKRADFTTAARVAEVVNNKFGAGEVRPATAQNSALVEVRMPQAYAGRNIEFLSELENLAVEPDHIAKIVINERTGTITAGKDIRIVPVAILHGGLSIEVQTSFNVSQPNEFARGRTTVTPQVGVGVKEDTAKNVSLKDGSTIDDLVKALTAIGATSRDVIAILQNLRSSGAFEAEVEVI